MDRPRRAATKVTDFRKYHLSGDLEQEVEGLVDTRISHFEMTTTAEELKQQLEAEKENSRRLQEEADLAEIQNQLEMEKMKQEQVRNALAKLKEAREQAQKDHAKCMEDMDHLASSNMGDSASNTLSWLRTQMDRISHKGPLDVEPETMERERQRQIEKEKEQRMAELRRQQEEISREMADLQDNNPEDTLHTIKRALNQKGDTQQPNDVLLQQLRSALSGKKEEDPNKLLLKALITQQNKTAGEGGTSTLDPSVLNRITSANSNTMADWLANLNKQEQGEFDPNRFNFPGEEETNKVAGSRKSGILEKAVTNIQQKQVWPQQNLGEDWADEGVEFKQMRFEHLGGRGDPHHRVVLRSR